MGRTGSTLILLVVALVLGGYLYFVESERPVADENAKPKVFSYDAANINQVQVKSSAGEVTTLRKGENDTWTIVQPAEAPADRNSVSEVVTNLATLEEQRVVEENAADLTAYGLAEPRMDVTFHVEGEKEPRRILFGEKTPANSGVYAKLPTSNRVFLVPSTIETVVDKSTFDFRDNPFNPRSGYLFSLTSEFPQDLYTRLTDATGQPLRDANGAEQPPCDAVEHVERQEPAEG